MTDIDRNTLPLHLARVLDRAQSGDKQAQFELALAYGTGVGVPRDCSIARSLLRSAAASSGGKVWVYSPLVGNGTSGRVIPVDTGPISPGFALAQTVLEEDMICSEGEADRRTGGAGGRVVGDKGAQPNQDKLPTD